MLVGRSFYNISYSFSKFIYLVTKSKITYLENIDIFTNIHLAVTLLIISYAWIQYMYLDIVALLLLIKKTRIFWKKLPSLWDSLTYIFI